MGAGIDRAGPDRAVALHLLHQGAVAFLGAPHNAVTRGKLTHQAFWKAVIEGKTIGEAFTEAMNNWIVVVEEEHNGNPTHASQNIVLIGDPAFRMNTPRSPIAQPARMRVSGDVVQVDGPAQWTINSETNELAHEWKWPGQLHYYGAPGVVLQYYWAGRYDKHKPYFFARFHTDRAVAELVTLSEAPAGLGWGGNFFVDEHADGTRTVLWRVRLLDYDVETGTVSAKLDTLSFQVVYGD